MLGVLFTWSLPTEIGIREGEGKKLSPVAKLADDGKRLDSPSLDVVLGKCGVSKRGGSSRGERAPGPGPGGGWRIYVGGVWASFFQYFLIFR